MGPEGEKNMSKKIIISEYGYIRGMDASDVLDFIEEDVKSVSVLAYVEGYDPRFVDELDEALDHQRRALAKLAPNHEVRCKKSSPLYRPAKDLADGRFCRNAYMYDLDSYNAWPNGDRIWRMEHSPEEFTMIVLDVVFASK